MIWVAFPDIVYYQLLKFRNARVPFTNKIIEWDTERHIKGLKLMSFSNTKDVLFEFLMLYLWQDYILESLDTLCWGEIASFSDLSEF